MQRQDCGLRQGGDGLLTTLPSKLSAYGWDVCCGLVGVIGLSVGLYINMFDL